MEGQVAYLLLSQEPTDRQQVQRIFMPKFQDVSGWRSFVRSTLNSTVTAQLSAPVERWSVRSFQALYVACWIHHPVEKGTFMIDLASIPVMQQNVIKAAMDKYCSTRPSSHLSGKGYSASEGWEFLQGYKELLVQFEATVGKPYLLLKSEGHTTGLGGIIPHMQSWAHKAKHGVGKQASPALNAIANPVSKWSGTIEGRAAENYAKGYGKMLKDVLKLSGKQVTVREMMQALFRLTGFPAQPNFAVNATNRSLGTILTQYCNAGPNYQSRFGITPDMVKDLRELAQTMQADGEVEMHRVYREVRATPADIDRSLDTFCNTQV
jgi:hypothetical protein